MIFGTDGIRGAVGVAPLDRDTIQKLSHVINDWLEEDALVVIGSDTRRSVAQVKDWITHGLGHARVLDLGVVPTPVVAYEAKARDAQLGIMITASHNPAGDNGLKFFDHHGLKIKYNLALNWSRRVLEMTEAGPESRPELKSTRPDHYREFIFQHFKPGDFNGFRAGFDLAHGAGTDLVRELTEDLGFEAVVIGDQPDGDNINAGVGALHTEGLSQAVKDADLPVGFALDGDGDRLAVVAPDLIHGDIVLYALYRIMLEEGESMNAMVGTIMCGMGLEQTLAAENVNLIRTQVGDQNVLAKLVEKGLPLGGEPSGHLIQTNLFPSGDGFLGALRIARAMKRDPQLLDKARRAVPMYDVFEKAYRVRHKPPLDSVQSMGRILAVFREHLGADGRVIVRYSGTEPKIRVFLEAPDLSAFEDDIKALEQTIQTELM